MNNFHLVTAVKPENTNGRKSSNEEKLLVIENKPEETLVPKTRPRSKSDRFARPSRKHVVDVYKQVLKYQISL